MDVLGAGCLAEAASGVGQRLQKQIGQTGIPVFNVANACATGATAVRAVYLASRRARPTWASRSASSRWARSDHDDFVVKPNRGSAGRGVLVVTGRDGAAIVRHNGELLRAATNCGSTSPTSSPACTRWAASPTRP